MAFCKNCRVHIATPANVCPLCQGSISSTGAEEAVYPVVGYSRSAVGIIHRISYFFMVLLLGTILFDLFTTKRSFWYLVGTLGFMYVGASLLYSLKSKQGVGYTLLKLVVVLSAVAATVDVSTGFHRWSTTYVIPFLVIGASFLVTLILLIEPKWFRDYFVYQITLCTLGLLTLLLRVLGLVTANWPVTTATVCSVCTIAGLFVFYGRKSIHEVKKRLHI